MADNGNAGFRRVSILFIIAGLVLAGVSTAMFMGAAKTLISQHGEQTKELSVMWRWFAFGLAATALSCMAAVFHLRAKAVAAGDETERKWSGADLFLLSFLSLFLELSLIRWVPAYTRMLSFFSNYILLACFLGLGAGCMMARSRKRFILATPPALTLLCIFTLGMFLLNFGNVLGNYIWGGTETRHEVFIGNAYISGIALKRIPIELNLALIFILTATVFVGVGQLLGRAMETMPPLKAYSINIGGGVAGIALFTICSFMALPAPVWFLVCFAILAKFLMGRDMERKALNISLLGSTLLMIFLFSSSVGNYSVYWSPYYKVTFQDEWPNFKTLTVNEVGHQVIWNPGNERIIMTSVPYLLWKNTHGAPPEDVLIIGPGTGNDVYLAEQIGASSIDAVEIDPVILRLGLTQNPMKPYDHPSVTRHINDGRAFLKRTDKKYDLVVFSVIDSLTLFSTYSSLHLESYLFTKESFQDIKRRLKPGGVFVFYNFSYISWLKVRTYRMMEEVYGEPVLMVTIPFEEEIGPDTPPEITLCAFMAGGVGPIKEALDKSGNKFATINNNLSANTKVNGFRLDPEGRKDVTVAGMTKVRKDTGFIMPTDDWPFYYKRAKGLAPHDFRGLAVILVCSLSFIGFSARAEILKFSLHFFFMGAAFMLLETAAITRLALLYGATWLVNSIVFFSILTVAFFSNLYVLKKGAPPRAALFPLLLLAALVGWLVPVEFFVGMEPARRFFLSGLVTFLPVAFSGIIFSSSFSGSKNPAAHLGSNLLGIIIGGMAVYIASVTGYRNLLIIVMALYALSWITAPRK